MDPMGDVCQEFYSTWTETPQQVTGRQPPSAPAPASVEPAESELSDWILDMNIWNILCIYKEKTYI